VTLPRPRDRRAFPVSIAALLYTHPSFLEGQSIH